MIKKRLWKKAALKIISIVGRGAIRGGALGLAGSLAWFSVCRTGKYWILRGCHRMNAARYVSFFIITFILQLVLFFVIKKDSGVTIVDMAVMSLLFAFFAFILDKILGREKEA